MMEPSAKPGAGTPLRIALAGLGTVGAGVIRLILANHALIAARAGRPIVISAISARNRALDRGVDLAPYAWEDDMTAMAARPDVDVVVELVGGADGPALVLARGAIAAGKALVTANKAMIAHHGMELASAAEAAQAADGGRGVPLKFEAAVAGAVPIVKALRDGVAANEIARVYGILNGTCNFILSTMAETGRDFADVLADAQVRGFAEADPAFDIEGIDAAHKLSILAAIAFGTRIDFAAVQTTGIARILAGDIAQAHALGYVIRLIALAETEAGALFQRVQPCLVPVGHPLAHVDGATNAVVAEGNFAGRLLFQGAGAGDGPTASAVVADLIDIARRWGGGAGGAEAPFSVPVAQLLAMPPADSGHRRMRAYIRFVVADRPGVLAEITAAMRDAGVSIESLIQQGRHGEEGEAGDAGDVLVAIVTHEGPEAAVAEALRLLDGSPSLAAPPLVMPLLGA